MTEAEARILDDSFRGYMHPTSIENENAAWYFLFFTVMDALSRYPTTLEEDLDLLKKDEKDKVYSTNE